MCLSILVGGFAFSFCCLVVLDLDFFFFLVAVVVVVSSKLEEHCKSDQIHVFVEQEFQKALKTFLYESNIPEKSTMQT